MRSSPFTSRLGNQQQQEPIGLYPFIQESANINQNCSRGKADQEVTFLALNILTIYGDSIKTANVNDFKEFIGSSGPGLKTEVMSVRLRAVHTYLQRLLRPIWEMNMTYRPKYHRFEKQVSNIDMFLPALAKLKDMLSTLE